MELTNKQLLQYDDLMGAGLSSGIGSPAKGKMCIEAVWCMVLGLEHGDDPRCVTEEIRQFKISLNDRSWSSNKARAKGIYNLGLAQIGSLGVIDGKKFLKQLQVKIIGKLIPDLFRKDFIKNKINQELVYNCEKKPTVYNCRLLAYAATTAYATTAYAATAYAATDATAYASSAAAANADFATNAYADYYLIMCANLAVEVLQEMNAPGCKYIKS